MIDITSQINAIKEASSFTSLKEVVAEAFIESNKNYVDIDTIKTIKETLIEIAEKINKLEDDISKNNNDHMHQQLKQDISLLRDSVFKISETLTTKIDSSYVDSEIKRLRTDLQSNIDSKANTENLDSIKDSFEKELSNKLDVVNLDPIKENIDEINETLAIFKKNHSKHSKRHRSFINNTDKEDMINGTYNVGDKMSEPTKSEFRKVYINKFKLEDDQSIIFNSNEEYVFSFVGFDKNGICNSRPIMWLSDGIYSAEHIKDNITNAYSDSYSLQIKRADNEKITESLCLEDFFSIEKTDSIFN